MMGGISLCPKCGKDDFEDSGKAIICKNCGYIIERPTRAPRTWLSNIIIYLPLFVFAGILIVPFFVYLFSGGVVLYLIATDIITIFTSASKPNSIDIISKLILYLIVCLALMELTQLIYKQYLGPAWDMIVIHLDYGEATDQIESTKIENDKSYAIKVIALAVIFILMHTFYMLFNDVLITHQRYTEYVLLIFGCLLGSAAILIAIGYWEKNSQLGKSN
jgi:hypothetical protein